MWGMSKTKLIEAQANSGPTEKERRLEGGSDFGTDQK